MKIHDLSSGLRIPLSNAEHDVLLKVQQHDGALPHSSLDEREGQLALELVQKGVLTRLRIKGKICYTVNSAANVRRI